MTINDLIDIKLLELYRNQEKRDYLGASGLGDECARRIQYRYMHEEPKIKATTIRTFDIGHCLEDLVAQWLIDSGFGLRTKDENNEQFGFSTANGKISGHIDGLIFSCDPEIEEVLNVSKNPLPWLWENKTMNHRSWGETAKHGVFATKFQYYVQVQLYMAYLDLDNCLFTALNKDSSELYFEVIKFDAETAQKYSDRAVDILKAIENNELLPRVTMDPNFFICKMCGFYDVCWEVSKGGKNE